MNDASTSASAPALDDPPDRSSSEEERGEVLPTTEQDDSQPPADTAVTSLTPTPSAQALTWQDRLTSKRKAALEDFFDTLDWLVYVQLAALYYLDTSTILLLLRLTTHLTPLPATLTLLSPLPRRRAHANIYLPLLALLVSLLTHIFASLPSPGEPTRFDNHGHILIDFVGQRAPVGWTGRARLLCMDLVVGALQAVMCGAAEALEQGAGSGKVGARSAASAANGSSSTASGAAAAAGMRFFGGQRARQLLGSLRGQAGRAAPEEVEMQPLAGPSSAGGRDDEVDETTQTGGETTAALDEWNDGDNVSSGESVARQGLETMYSGQTLLVDVRLWDMMVSQYYEQRNRRLAGRV